MTTRILNTFNQHLEKRRTQNRLRTLYHTTEPVINLMTNDYHGFSKHPLVSKTPSGAGGSRLLGGNHPAIENLEKHICQALSKEACLVFPSGFQCHQSVLETLIETNEFVVIDDQLNHASLQTKQSKIPRYRFRHHDLKNCEVKLQAAQKRYPRLTPLIIAESIHSMDGTVLALPAFIELKKKYKACLVLDEAHAVGVCGNSHLGLADEHGCTSDVDIILGTFSKGLGAMGAFVATQKIIADYLINYCKGFIYTTALSPGLADIIQSRLERLNQNDYFINRLRHFISEFSPVLNTTNTHSPLSPVFQIPFSSNSSLCEARDHLAKHTIAVGLIRPPTYPQNMLRVCLSSELSDHNWNHILSSFDKLALEARN
jgi:8-amino-7-oxononanoate synthase